MLTDCPELILFGIMFVTFLLGLPRVYMGHMIERRYTKAYLSLMDCSLKLLESRAKNLKKELMDHHEK